ncbi:unnamed protein product [Ceutorhynchus assimilis]|uniref:Centrosome-associated protein 350 n=1 Tax=Ceutorhynchus assimilis TaxID=467358 RepID=A0A9P0GKQ4_9CUCU|nr:unnamed protein product [Ceutorhynchus assimilis]
MNMEKPEEKPKVNISEKIQQTIRERERLQQELQAIIASGIRGPIDSVTPIPVTHNLIPESVNKVQIIKSYDPKHSERVKEPPVSPTKKSKTYNVEHARGYIKKQKDKRMEELRNRKVDTKLAAQLRKEKLEELRQKASEIVKKNVETKRARSKSREAPIVRSLSGNRTQRSLSRDNGGSESRLDPNLLCPPDPVYGLRKIEPKNGKENHEKINKPPALTKVTIPIDAELSKEKIVIHSSNRASRSRLMEPGKKPNLLCPPNPVSSEIQSIVAPNVKENERNNEMPPPEVPTMAGKNVSESLQPLETSASIKKSFQSQSKSDSRNKNLEIISNITLRRSNDNLSLLPELTPQWLQTQPPSSDPYNFINTVKRHLKYAVEEQKPNFVDVGVQGDLDSSKSSKKSDLKSFLSHRLRKGGPTITQPSTSDSDTSKNIPSISSESGTSLRKNAEFLRQSYVISDLKPLTDAPPNLDAKKIEDVRLNDGVNKVRKHLFKDFIEVSPSGKRDSFISGNCAKKSPNRIPLVTPMESDAKSSTNSELNKALQESQPISEVLSTNSENITCNEGSVKIIYGNCSKKFRSGICKPKSTELKQKIAFSLGQDSSSGIESSQKYTSLFSTLRPSTEDSHSKKKIQSLSKSSGTAEAYTKFSNDLSLNRKTHRRSIETQSHKNTSSESLDTIKSSLETSINQELLSDVTARRSITIRERYQEESEKQRNSSFESFTNNIISDLQNSATELVSGSSQSIHSEIENPHSSNKLESSLGIQKRSSSKHSQDLFKTKSENLIPKNTLKSRNLLSKSETNIYDHKETANLPKLSLNIGIGKTNRKVDNIVNLKNITIRSGDRNCDKFNSAHEIHLKFEAEIDLLTDFNQTIRRFSEIEKTFESLRIEKNNTEMVTKVLQNRDTQTSIASASASKNTPSETKSSENATVESDTPDNQQSLRLIQENQQSLNLTGASNMGFGLTSVNIEDTLLDNTDNTSSIMLKMTQTNFEESPRGGDFVSDENAVFRSVVGMSLKMFDQMIKDEDSRIENWKKVVKIREQALLDRTKGELVWLEMQKKQLIETGKLTEASVIKKKQRGIILKHQQERNEMQKLKQMQKQDSQNRKALLKRERNVIKYQMLTETPSKVKSFSHREKSDRRISGPFKVIQNSESTTTTVHSEGSALGTDLEVKSITTRTSMSHSLVNASETFNNNNINKDLEMLDLAVKRADKANVSTNDILLMKQTLLMREHALAKRRKAVEDLLQWHKKLLDEEKSIENMEKKIGTIISKIPNNKTLLPPDSNIPSEVPSTVEQPASLEKNTQSEESNQATYYSTDFEVDTAPQDSQNSDEQSSISSISQLIGDLGKIEENIMNLMPKESSNKEISETVEESVIFVDEIKSEEEETAPISVEPIVTENIISEEFIKESSSEEQNTVEEETISKEPTFINEEAIEILDETLEEHITDAISEQLESSKSPEPLLQIETIPIPSNEEDTSSPRQNEEIQDIPDPEPSTSHPSSSTQEEDISEESAEEAEDEHQNKTDEEKVAERGIQSIEEIPQATEVSQILSPIANNLEIEEIANDDSNIETSQNEDVASIIEAPSHQEVKSIVEEVVSLDTSGSSYSSDSAVVSPISSVTTPPTTASGSQKSPIDITKSPTDSPKHVEELLNLPKKDKSPRMQDLCLGTDTTFSREASSDTGSTLNGKGPFLLGSEAEELHRKQLAIEQEIKLLKEQQQKEAASPVYVREIPNKPPPPYTPPFKTKSPKSPSIIPATKDEIEQITEYSAKIIYKAYLSNNLDNISISDNTLNLIAKNIDKGCYKYIFDLCKEVARDHYSQFADDTGPTWMQLDRRITLAPAKPLDVNGLKKLMTKSLLELFGFENQHYKQDNAVMRWSKKKRDHVDQVLVQEMQAEESTWTNFDKDEALIKDRLTTEIMEILLKEAAMVIENAFQKKIGSNI